MWAVKARFGDDRDLIKQGGVVKLFPYKKDAKEWAEKSYGYIRNRKDLTSEPHAWKVPVPVRVKVIET